MSPLWAAAWLALGATGQVPAGARPITLAEAYALALKRSEELAQRGEAAAELEARVAELWSAVKPRIAARGTELVQDVPPPEQRNSFTQRNREEARLAAHQPLFSGLREFLAARATRAQSDSARLALRRAEQRLYQDVAKATLDLWAQRRAIATRERLAKITQERLDELYQRRRVGKSRESELLAAQSQLARNQAELQQARGGERVFQFNLRFLTGLDAELAPADPPSSPARALDEHLRDASRRPDVAAARLDLRAAALAVDIERRAAWPSLALDGNYYLKRPPGFQQELKWDVTFTADLPLYSGGALRARAKQADARRRGAEAALQLAHRRAEVEIRSAYDDLQTAGAVSSALEKALELAEANAKAQAADYRLGMVTNLDVLGSLDTLQQTRLQYDAALANAAFARARLEVAAGLPAGNEP